jgi:replicative DNA helicase
MKKETKDQSAKFDFMGLIPPQAVDIEEAVLGALMIEKGSLDKISLKPIEFYKESHQKIFEIILELDKESNPLDILSVGERLKNKGLLEEIGGPYFLSSLATKVSTASNIEYHSLIVHDRFVKRQLIQFSSMLAKKAYDDSEDTFDVLDYANFELDKINNDIQLEDDTLSISESLKLTLEQLKEREKLYSQGKSIGINTPVSVLTKWTGGWQPKQFIIFGARPGAGKTSFALAVMKAAAEYGKSVFLASLEMANTEITGKMIVGASGVNADNFKFGNIDVTDWGMIEKAAAKLYNLKIFIDDKPKNINRIKSKTKLLHRKGNCDLLILDYLQLAGAGDEGKKQNREQEISYISRTCKMIAQELDIPVIALSQLNRDVENRTGTKRPQLSDLRESGSLEQDADIVIFIYRPQLYGFTENENGELLLPGQSELIIAKHRGGRLGSIDFRFNESLTAVYDIDAIEDSVSYSPSKDISPNYQFESQKEINEPF